MACTLERSDALAPSIRAVAFGRLNLGTGAVREARMGPSDRGGGDVAKRVRGGAQQQELGSGVQRR
jgi:hypothetical protein